MSLLSRIWPFSLFAREEAQTPKDIETICSEREIKVKVQLQYDESGVLKSIACPNITPYDIDDGGCFSAIIARRGACGFRLETCPLLKSKGLQDTGRVTIKQTSYSDNRVEDNSCPESFAQQNSYKSPHF